MNTEIVPFNKFTFKINDSIIDDISFMRFNSALQGKLNFNLYSNEDNFVKILEEKNEALQPMDYLDEFNSKFIHENYIVLVLLLILLLQFLNLIQFIFHKIYFFGKEKN